MINDHYRDSHKDFHHFLKGINKVLQEDFLNKVVHLLEVSHLKDFLNKVEFLPEAFPNNLKDLLKQIDLNNLLLNLPFLLNLALILHSCLVWQISWQVEEVLDKVVNQDPRNLKRLSQRLTDPESRLISMMKLGHTCGT